MFQKYTRQISDNLYLAETGLRWTQCVTIEAQNKNSCAVAL